MANPEHLAILKQGVEAWNEWRLKNAAVRPDLSEADLSKQSLIGANLKHADLRAASLKKATLQRASLQQADLGEINHGMIEGEAEPFLVQCDLGEADLNGANLEGANLEAAGLYDARLDGANLSGANLGRAQLWGAKLTRASLYDTNLSQASLREASLRNASLIRANLRAASFEDADFTGAEMRNSVFADVDLSGAKGLETVKHFGPSTVGIDTIYKSQGRIPDIFLRGCGVPDDLIGYIKSIAGSIQFYSCFISYSTKDQEFADRLYADLQARGVRCWFAEHDIRGGRKIHEQIDEAIRLHDKLLLILSEGSMSSDWVQTEIAKARKREAQEKRQMLFPVALVPYDLPPHEAQKRRSPGAPEKPTTIKEWELINSAGEDVAEKIREYFIPDFSNWKDHDSYQQAFQRLISDLKAESK